VRLRHPPHGPTDRVPLDGDADGRTGGDDAKRRTDYASDARDRTLARRGRRAPRRTLNHEKLTLSTTAPLLLL
jgi:hypothetical protein